MSSSATEQIAEMNGLARRKLGAAVDGGRDDVPTPPVVEGEHGLPAGAPWIELPGAGRPLEAFAREVATVCREANTFRRGRDTVYVDEKTGSIEVIEPDEFLTWISDYAVTFKWSSGGKGRASVSEPMTMTAATAKGCLASRHFLGRLNELKRVNGISQPILRGNETPMKAGKIELLNPGYDEASGIFTRGNRVAVERMPLADAVRSIKYLLKDFPFVSPLDLAIQVSAMVSFYGSLLLPVNAPRMNFALKANKHRSGKTLLIQTTIVPVQGRCVIEPWPDNPDELKQLLNTTVNDGADHLVLDDVMGHVRSGALNAFLTASWWGFRGYHTQRKKIAERQAVVFLSGHDMTLQADLEGRFLDCRLYVQEADSMAHKVPNPIDESWLAREGNRSDICSALFSIIAAWDEGGRPLGKVIKPGFQAWCETYGGILEFAGFVNPCQSRPDEERGDNEFSDMAALVASLRAEFAEGERYKEFTFLELLERCAEGNFLTWKLDGKWRTETEKSGSVTHTKRTYEPTKRCEGAMAHLLNDKFGGTRFKVGAESIEFGKAGKNRSRRYTLAIVA